MLLDTREYAAFYVPIQSWQEVAEVQVVHFTGQAVLFYRCYIFIFYHDILYVNS